MFLVCVDTCLTHRFIASACGRYFAPSYHYKQLLTLVVISTGCAKSDYSQQVSALSLPARIAKAGPLLQPPELYAACHNLGATSTQAWASIWEHP